MASIQLHTGLLGQRLAKHLLRRTSYRYTLAAIDNLAALSVNNAVNSLFNSYTMDMEEPLDEISGQPFINSGAEAGVKGTNINIDLATLDSAGNLPSSAIQHDYRFIWKILL